jgi:23S rRNA (guanosine2251-2'-O)-methyltransferase
MAFTIYGIHPVLEALKHRPRAVHRIILARQRDESAVRPVIELAKKAHIKIDHEQAAHLDRLAGSEQHQGVVAEAEPYPVWDLDAALAKCRKESAPPLLLVLDSIQDPHNFGALIRSAVCAGAQSVIFPKDRSAPLTATVGKASAGAVEHIPLCRVTNIAATLAQLKEENIWVVGTSARAETSLYRFDFNRPLALVIGSEGRGMRPLVEKTCDLCVSIPLQAGFDSLNASTAGAVVLFEAMRQRMSG